MAVGASREQAVRPESVQMVSVNSEPVYTQCLMEAKCDWGRTKLGAKALRNGALAAENSVPFTEEQQEYPSGDLTD